MTWRKVQFKEIVEFPPKVKLETGEEYDFIPMDQVDGGVKYVQDIDRKTYTGGGAKFSNGDTIFARITPCLENGKIAKVKNLEKGIGFGSTEFFVFRAIEGASDPDFIYYLAKSETIRQPAIKSMVGASGRQRADKGVVEEIVIPVPPLPTQRRIASILSAYDDLIENNLKRIKLLEEAAQNIYREWFVHFRFPGHERVRRGADGLPEGWRRVPIGSITDVNKETLSSKNAPHSISYIDISSTESGYFAPPSELEFSLAPSRARRILRHGDTIFSTVRPNRKIYALILNPEPNLIASTGFAVVSPRDERDYPFIYQTVSSDDFVKAASAIATGAAYPAVSQSDFEKIPVIKPDDVLIGDFGRVSVPILEQKDHLLRQNKLLKEARDILLPRLMNRTIEV